jgi:aspartate aminotransferase-like enzyme
MNKQLAEKRYLQQRAQARMRKVPFTITLEDWIKVWADSGKWEQRGRRKDQYCMSRIGDKGGYEIGNVFIQLSNQNVREGNLGKVYTSEQCLAIKQRLIGSKHTEQRKRNIGLGVMTTNKLKETSK